MNAQDCDLTTHLAEIVAERNFLERALLQAAERESRRIGQELHENVCQLLLGAAFGAKALAYDLDPESSAAKQARDLAQLLNSAVQQARDFARGLNPVDLDASGLVAALQELTQRPCPGPPCRLECERPVLLSDAGAAVHAYRIAQEAVANAAKHSGASEVVVRLNEDEHVIRLEITDDGSGFDRGPAVPKSVGLESMKYRAHALGGRLSIDTPEGGGTRVVCVFPKHQ